MKNVWSIIAVAVLTALVVACPSPFESGNSSESGEVQIEIQNGLSASATLTPGVDMTVASFTVEFSKDGEDTVTGNTAVGAAEPLTLRLPSLGTWTVTATGFNADGVPIAGVTEEHTISDWTDASISLTVVPFTGTGVVRLTVGVPSTEIGVGDVTGELTRLGTDETVSLTATEISGSYDATFQLENDEVSAGYYQLTVQVQKDGILRYGVIEAVRVIQDETTLGTFALSETQADGFALANPVASVAAGTYDEAQTVTLSTPTDGATIRYTTNGLEPTGSNGAVYDGESIEIGTTTTLKARATKEGLAASDTLNLPVEIDGTIATPTLDTDEGLYFEPITINFSSENAALFQSTTNGTTDPTVGGAFGPSVTVGNGGQISLRVVGTDSGGTTTYSDEATATYRVTGYVPDPTIDIASGTYNVPQTVTLALSEAMAEAEIRYTLDGSTPDLSSTLYEAPFDVEQTTTVKARAFRNDWGDSQIVSSEIELVVVDPTATPPTTTFGPSDTRTVSLATSTTGTEIRYSTDGTSPTEVYTDPIPITVTGTELRFQAVKDGWSDSQVVTETYSLKLDAPTADPTTVSGETEIILTATRGRILYTTDGSDPAFGQTGTTIYSESSKPTVDTGVILKAIAEETGWISSDMMTITY
jgi:hypothetical protein